MIQVDQLFTFHYIDVMNIVSNSFRQAAQDLLAGQIKYFYIDPFGTIITDLHQQQLQLDVIVSGSFNPFHKGHKMLYEAGKGKKAAYELSAFNVDKPPLGIDELLRRIGQFAGRPCRLQVNNCNFN